MAGPTNNINDANARIRQDALETASIVEEALRSIADSVSTAFESALGASNTVSQAVAKDLQKSFNTLSKVSKETASNITKLQDGLLKSKTVQEQINKRKSEELSLGISLATALKAQGAQVGSIDKLVSSTTGKVKEQNKTYKNLSDEQKTIVQQYAEALKYSKEQTAELQKQEKQAKEIEDAREKSLGVSGKVLKTLGGITGLGDSAKKAQIELNEYAEEYRKTNEKGEYPSKMQSLGKAISLTGKNFVKDLLDPAILLGSTLNLLVKGFLEVDKQTEDLARNMNMSYDSAADFRFELAKTALSAGSLYVSTKGLAETNLAINASLGTNVKLTDENVIAFTKLRTAAGLTNEELMGAQALTLTNGKTLNENADIILKQANFTGRKNGVLLNEKQILKGIKDISAATTLTLGKNPGLLAHAAATAKSLGLEMSQVESISNSLLDFQSSIENELSAELLTGKQLNLETARYAALTGDVATVASEVAAQLGSAAEFGEMNRLQQEAIAKAVGMNREELAKTLYVQEQLRGISGDQAKVQEDLINKRIEEVGLAQAQAELAKGGVELLEQQAGRATEFKLAMDRIKEVVADFVAGPLGQFLTSTTGIYTVLTLMAISALPKLISGFVLLGKAAKAFKLQEIGAAIASAWTAAMSSPQSLLTGGLVGLAIGAALTAAIMSATSEAGDLFSAGGYGRRTLVAPEGTFRLNDNDNIIATTNPVNVNDMISGPAGSMRPTSTQQPAQAMNSQINIAPSNTRITLSLDGMAIGNANAKQDYGVSKNIKAFGGGFDYSA
jgi:hypothetical protein